MPQRRPAPALLVLSLLLSLLLGLLPTVAASPTTIAPAPIGAGALPGAGAPHPRILLWPEQLDVVRDRVTREPLTTLLASVRQSTVGAPPANPADQAECEKSANEGREVAKAGAARTLAFSFVLDREVVDGSVTALDPTDRTAMADDVRDYLLAMCRRSRIKVNPDRDLGTGHELLGYATAYDLLLGGGYVFDPADEAQIVDNLVTLATDFHLDYQTLVGGFLTNNHGLKGAASLGIAAIVLAEYAPPGAAPDDPRWPRKWLDRAVDFSDEVLRHTYGPGDGAYGESPHYLKFAMQNVFSFLRAWNRANGGGSWTTEAGLTLPDLWTHPAFTRSARWLLDMTLPDGTLAPIDDGNGGEHAFWGAYPADFPGVGALYWRWRTQATQDYGGSVDNRLDTIAAYDDTIAAAPPAGPATAFYEEGGSAVFRSGWGDVATLAIVQGEHGAARELGRTRDGTGQEYSAPHDHSDPGSLQLHADGEPLLVDGGYINYPWTLQWVLNKPSDHNMVLVDPPSADGNQESPEDTLAASTRLLWDPANRAPFFTTPNAASPVDGDAQIFDTLDSSFVDTASVVSSYGVGEEARVERRTAFVEERFLVVADTGMSPTSRTWTWPLHGNAGGADGTFPGAAAKPLAERRPLGAAALPPAPQVAAGGTFIQTAAGGQWTRPSGTGLTAGLAFDVDGRTATALPSYHEQGYKVLAQHTALRTAVTAPVVHGVQILYPTPGGQAPPTTRELAVPGAAALLVDDPDGDSRAVAVHRAGGGRLVVPAPLTGLPEISTDADLLVVTASTEGVVRSVWAEHATEVVIGGVRTIRSDDPGNLGVSFSAGRADVVAEVADPVLDLDGLGFTPTHVSGACEVTVDGSTVHVARGREARFTVSDGVGTGAPAADPGPTRRVSVGTAVGLDGTASCDAGGSPLSYRWELVSAPAGSAWTLDGAGSPTPTLLADRAGIYRVELVVTDSGGTASEVAEVEVMAGPGGLDTVDGDLDGRFDAADPDVDSGDLRYVPVTPTRVLDSRRGLGTVAGAWGPSESATWWSPAVGPACPTTPSPSSPPRPRSCRRPPPTSPCTRVGRCCRRRPRSTRPRVRRSRTPSPPASGPVAPWPWPTGRAPSTW